MTSEAGKNLKISIILYLIVFCVWCCRGGFDWGSMFEGYCCWVGALDGC